MDEAEMDRVKSFIKGMWARTMTNLAADGGRHGRTTKESQGVASSSRDDQPESGDITGSHGSCG